MPAHKKRKIAEPECVPRPLPSYMEEHNRELTTSFEKFEDAMCDLLASASVVTNLHGVLGDEKASFVVALQHMITVGDLAWVKEIDSDGEEVVNNAEIMGGRVAHGGQTPLLPEGGASQQLPTVSHDTQDLSHEWPPPLPPIPNPSLRLQVFTPSEPNNMDDPQSHYQRLEWLGDAYLEAVVSRILFDRFPDEREGYLTRIRQKLVTNRTISSLANLYGFENRIMGICDLPNISKTGKKKAEAHWKILADCFEAYIAAVAISDPGTSLETLINWLAPLYGPEIELRQNLRRDSILKPKIRFTVAPAVRRPELRRTKSPSVLQPPGAGKHPTRRLGNIRARSRPLPGPIINRRSRQRGPKESGLPTAIDENESDWEEIESPEEAVQTRTRMPLNDNAKIHLRRIIGGDDVTLNYKKTGQSGASVREPGREACQQGHQFHVTALFTGYGFINKPLGSGCGVTEYEAGQRAAMAVLKNKSLLIRLKQLKAGESVAYGPLSLESAMNNQHHTLSSIPTYPESPTSLVFQASPTVIQRPWAPVLQPVWDMDDICTTGSVRETKITIPNSVQSAYVIRALREDMHDLVMIDDD